MLSQIERIAHVAFRLAQKRRRQLCSVEKSNVLDVSRLWKEVVIRLGADYPDVELSHMCTFVCLAGVLPDLNDITAANE